MKTIRCSCSVYDWITLLLFFLFLTETQMFSLFLEGKSSLRKELSFVKFEARDNITQSSWHFIHSHGSLQAIGIGEGKGRKNQFLFTSYHCLDVGTSKLKWVCEQKRGVSLEIAGQRLLGSPGSRQRIRPYHTPDASMGSAWACNWTQNKWNHFLSWVQGKMVWFSKPSCKPNQREMGLPTIG